MVKTMAGHHKLIMACYSYQVVEIARHIWHQNGEGSVFITVDKYSRSPSSFMTWYIEKMGGFSSAGMPRRPSKYSTVTVGREWHQQCDIPRYYGDNLWPCQGHFMVTQSTQVKNALYITHLHDVDGCGMTVPMEIMFTLPGCCGCYEDFVGHWDRLRRQGTGSWT
jgi:hypothetical protein